MENYKELFAGLILILVVFFIAWFAGKKLVFRKTGQMPEFRDALPCLLKWFFITLSLDALLFLTLFFNFRSVFLENQVFYLTRLIVLLFISPLGAGIIFFSQFLEDAQGKTAEPIEPEYENFYKPLLVTCERMNLLYTKLIFVLFLWIYPLSFAAVRLFSAKHFLLGILVLLGAFFFYFWLFFQILKLEKIALVQLKEAFDRPEEEIPLRVRILREEVLFLLERRKRRFKYKNKAWQNDQYQTSHNLKSKSSVARSKSSPFYLARTVLQKGGYKRKTGSFKIDRQFFRYFFSDLRVKQHESKENEFK